MATDESESSPVELLTSIPYFAHVGAPTLEAIGQALIRRSVERDQIVLMEGEVSTGLFVVEQGWLKSVKTSAEGREQVIRVVGPGEVFNAIGVLTRETNPGTVMALEPATVWILPRQDLLRLLQEDSTLAWTIIRALADRIQALMKQVEDLSLHNVEARLARFLIENAEEGNLKRRQWETQSELAARLGTVPDVLNRALRRLTDVGLIRVNRRQILILDRDGLVEAARLGDS